LKALRSADGQVKNQLRTSRNGIHSESVREKEKTMADKEAKEKKIDSAPEKKAQKSKGVVRLREKF